MLPSEKIELAIYRRIKGLGPGAVSMTLGMLSEATGEEHFTIMERLKGLELEERISLSKYSGGHPEARKLFSGDLAFFYSGDFLITVLPQGRKYFEQLEQEADQKPKHETQKQLIFISCGQSTPAERELGQAVAKLVEQKTGCTAYFAQDQTSLQGVTENILKALHEAIGFIAIMHPRGNVSNPHSPTDSSWVRGSVWIEQEIAIAAFISQALQRPMQVRAYVYESIQREGLRDKLHVNPKSFRDDSEILTDLATLLPAWRIEPLQTEVGVEMTLSYQKLTYTGERHNYRLTVTAKNTGQDRIDDYHIDVLFPSALLLKDVNYLSELPSRRTATHHLFRVSRQSGQATVLYPGDPNSIMIIDYYMNREIFTKHPEVLQMNVTATLYVKGSPPVVVEKPVFELQNF